MIGWLILIGILVSPFVWYWYYTRLPRDYRLHVKYKPTGYSAYAYTVVYEGDEGDNIILNDDSEFLIWTRLIACRRARQHRRFTA